MTFSKSLKKTKKKTNPLQVRAIRKKQTLPQHLTVYENSMNCPGSLPGSLQRIKKNIKRQFSVHINEDLTPSML